MFAAGYIFWHNFLQQYGEIKNQPEYAAEERKAKVYYHR